MVNPHLNLEKAEWNALDDKAVAVARALAMDAVQKVGNGHPGTAMSLAPVAYTLFQRFLRHDPKDPQWIGRDRFILSCGHSSLTLYIQLFFSGYGLSLDDLKAFRTWGSLTPGHPEFGHTAGVETTTGPLGQGLANAVGFAIAEIFANVKSSVFKNTATTGDVVIPLTRSQKSTYLSQKDANGKTKYGPVSTYNFGA